jgi:hypothetical protein
VSTIKTISITKNTHLYEDLHDRDTVYIEVEDISECSFEIWTSEDTN